MLSTVVLQMGRRGRAKGDRSQGAAQDPGRAMARTGQQAREQIDGGHRQRPGGRRVSMAFGGPQGDINTEGWDLGPREG